MDPLVKANELRNQRSAVTHKILETQLALAKIRKIWLVDGQQTPISVRAELDYDLAALDLQRHTIDRELAGLDKVKREAYAATFQGRLLAALEERGLGDLVAEVRRSLAQESPVFVDRECRTQPTPADAPPAP